MRSRAQNISLEHEPLWFFLLQVDAIQGVLRLLRVLVLRYVHILPSFIDLIIPTVNQTLLRLLHLPCLSCNTNHCRGCFKPTQYPPHCPGGPSCTIWTCCLSICAMALFELLCSFDNEYAGFVANNSPTGEFINVVIAHTDKRTRTFKGMLVSTLRSVSSWLLHLPPLNPSCLVRGYIPPSPNYSQSPTSPQWCMLSCPTLLVRSGIGWCTTLFSSISMIYPTILPHCWRNCHPHAACPPLILTQWRWPMSISL